MAHTYPARRAGRCAQLSTALVERRPLPVRLHLSVWCLACAILIDSVAISSPASATGATSPVASTRVPSGPSRTPSASVPFGVWVSELAQVLDTVRAPTVDREFGAFAESRKLPADNVSLRRDYRRLRLLFEAVRDGGFWHLRWDVTDQNPSSQRIWRAFIEQPLMTDFAAASVTAECDESSALLGLLARRMQIASVGLFYPTWNHTIAAWAPLGGKVKEAGLVMLPTTQIFLACEAGFDSTSFRTGLRNIERYPGWDIRNTTLLPQERAGWLLEQIRTYSAASAKLWSLIRALRAYQLDSSMGRCREMRAALASELRRELTEDDENALKALATRELHQPRMQPRDVLEWLARQ